MAATRHKWALGGEGGFRLSFEILGSIVQYLFIFGALVASLKVFSSESDAPKGKNYCQNIGGVKELGSQTFLYELAADPLTRSVLLPEESGLAQFIELRYTDQGVQFLNRLPQLGLPFSI
jgi:hypothetical protein